MITIDYIVKKSFENQHAFPYGGIKCSCKHMRYTITDPNVNPVRNITALKHR